MKFIKPSVEYWPQEAGMEGVWKQIAKATRVCYQSTPRGNESDEDFVKKVILKPALIEGDLNDLEHCKFDFNKMHGSCLEHGTVYLTVDYHDFTKEDDDNNYDFNDVTEFYEHNRYSKVTWAKGFFYVATNMRVIIENKRTKDLRFIDKVTKYHPKRYTFSIITDIGVTREMNRHRTFSICEQSTRYCDFNKDKFGRELIFIKPAWWKQDNSMNPMLASFQETEQMYQRLRKHGWKPEQARQVLPLGLKTQAIYTAFADDWQHFINLRADNVSGKAHPNIQWVANETKRMVKEQKLSI